MYCYTEQPYVFIFRVYFRTVFFLAHNEEKRDVYKFRKYDY